MTFHVPCRAVGAVAVRGWIEQNGVVGFTSAQLSLHKIHRVVMDPAHGGLQFIEFQVFPCPRDRGFRRVDVRDAVTRLGERDARAARVGE